MEASLTITAALLAAAAAAYATIAVLLHRREVASDYRLPLRLFAFWWATVALVHALAAIATFAASVGVTQLALYVTHGYLERLLVPAGLSALIAYVGFLVTGDRRTWAPAAAFYAVYYLASIYLLAAGSPIGIDVPPWGRPTLILEEDTGLWRLGLLGGLLVPPLIACAFYYRLSLRSQSASQRRRVAVVAGGTAAWLIISVTAYFASGNALLQLLNRGSGVAIAVSILLVTAAQTSAAQAQAPVTFAPAGEDQGWR